MSVLRPYFPYRPDILDIDDRQIEQALRDRLEATLMGLHRRSTVATNEEDLVPFDPEAEFSEVRLEGSFPQTEVVVHLTLRGHEGVRFGARRRIWEDDGAYSSSIDVFDTNLLEVITNRRDDRLREQKTDESGMVWLLA